MTQIQSRYDRRVYSWETAHVSPHDRALCEESTTRAIVQHVWEREGLRWPPKVMIDPRMCPDEGSGHRMTLTLGPSTKLHVILHELAHSMDFSLESSVGMGRLESETPGTCHDGNWMGLYVRMLDRYIGGIHFNQFYLWSTLHRAGLEFAINPKPRCI